ncbi:Cytochrome c [Rubripirellula tenax]|uniref:Cytochrome c n=1 Tax=Rubripirellula tenax TaxID=2528015 RepID=A0A5C6ES12_9BACT|nr:c-type cytochrome [Rubripirellula tenax]TWU50887.1 Cytochrome c [Rubripirellula tenax]
MPRSLHPYVRRLGWHGCVVGLLLGLPFLAAAQETRVPPTGNDQVTEAIATFENKGVQPDASQPTSPAKVGSTFRTADGVAIDLIANEPDVAQPLFCSWDSKGRLWVVQYRQYQYPAGLKVVRFDQYLRAVFDKVPEPPPHGAPGLDKITLYEDRDGDGFLETSRDVIDGLNIATSVQTGDGGIWVLNPPYLLFYPDENDDDVPDGDPEVHLSGFGIQDTHSVANSLTWGVDGWLYGANGSTTGSTTGGTIKSPTDSVGIAFEGQCIWRYHPRLHRFEIYAEGGGNTFSFEMDAGGQVFSGTNSGNTRGYHYPQGGYFEKNWGKHGPLTNPYALGYLKAMPSDGDDRRFPQAFLIYESDLFGPSFLQTIVAPNSLHNVVWHSDRVSMGSTYRTVDRDNLVESSDRWFRPVYAGVGPDGSIYMADWYDTRLSHLSPTDNWHKTSGRLYRVRPTDSPLPKYTAGDLSQATNDELISHFDSDNKWLRQRSVLELSWRDDVSIVDRLIAKVRQSGSLEALWTLHGIERLDARLIKEFLNHRDAPIRRWTIRLLGDGTVVNDTVAVDADFRALASGESDVQVRSQWASSAKRLPADVAIPIVDGLLDHTDDLDDPQIPLLIWWAVENHADELANLDPLLRQTARRQRPLFQQVILARLMQRYALIGTQAAFASAEQLIGMVEDEPSTDQIIRGLNQAFVGRSIPSLPPAMGKAMTEYRQSLGKSGIVLRLRQEGDSAVKDALAALADASIDEAVRAELLATLGTRFYPGALPTLLAIATGNRGDAPALQRAAIAALAVYDAPDIAQQLLTKFQTTISAEHELRDTACRTLASRLPWAQELVAEVNAWRMKPQDLSADVIQRLRTFDDPVLTQQVDRALGPVITVSSAETARRINELIHHMSEALGDATSGKLHYEKKCASCHMLFGQGHKVGPPLDGYERGNAKFWLPAILDPSLEIREGFQSFRALTIDGRVITGMIADRSPHSITFRGPDQKTTLVPREEIDQFDPLATSLMPAQLLDDMTNDEVIDLLAYLMQSRPQSP